jgi:hypothetical protein
MKTTIQGLIEAQEANIRAIRAMQPDGALGQAIKQGTQRAHAYAAQITHKDTTALARSHRMEVVETRGRVYIDKSARNPRTGDRTADYGPVEHRRGGSHAFYERTEKEAGPRIAADGIQVITGGLR